MRFRPASRAVLAGASLLAATVAPASLARADYIVGSTVIPTSSVVTSTFLPTSYVSSSSIFPTSYASSAIIPTSYTSSFIPTSYVSSSSIFPTSYVMPTSTIYPTSSIIETGGLGYYPTSYVSYYRGGLFRPRRFVERTSYYGTPSRLLTPTAYYAPTTYLTPTSYLVPTMATSSILPTTYISGSYVTPTSVLVDNGVITTSATAEVCCDSSPSNVVAAAPTRVIAPTQAQGTASGQPIYSSKKETEPTMRSTDRVPTSSNIANSGAEPPVVAPEVLNPPPAPVPARSGGTAGGAGADTGAATDPGPSTSPPGPDRPSGIVPTPEPGTMGGQQPRLQETSKRIALRPNYASTKNILRGRVVSYETSNPEEFVTVVLVSRTNAFEDRPIKTNADGEFKISLPDGDWAVKVTMPSGSLYTVARAVTASGGRVVDGNNKPVGELLITR